MNTPPVKIILVKPRNPDNIGAAARALANFGFCDLALVSAFESDWKEAAAIWRKEASVSAIGCMEIIDSTRVFASIPEAAADCAVLFGTSSLHRMKPDRDVLPLSEAPEVISKCGGKAGILFGSEKTGLTKEDLSFCRAIINIPTREKQPSMNLGQAVAIVAYELAARGEKKLLAGRAAAPEASPVEIARVTAEICARLERQAGPHWGGEAQARAIRRGLTDARLTKDAMTALKQLLKTKQHED
ncbi:MAG: hypothetical protein A2X35_05305 [Elusimicrobia bacterium GWA2_61_42]|nr:MAG: hypothetical protein A2X35_05305 [Elusimicrobia bacterium GWA2_61_42]OGR74212.1 MAG: hypothetical protein A2X38_11360 [Elusimicrobia bacterium GWC2_61_25]